VQHEFSTQEMYKKAAEFWTELRLELISASTYFGIEKGNASQLWRIYWASHQVLFVLFICFLFWLFILIIFIG
jgi:hypothetical protein